jgi:Cu/Ag efflux protein CusF
MKLINSAILFTIIVLGSTVVFAQDGKTVKKEAAVTATATIEAIDPKTRAITLKNEKGEQDVFVAGPEVKRFNELKVGDRIRVTYHESLVFQLRKPGSASTPSSDTVTAGRTEAMPGGGVASQQTRTVTVKAVDMATGHLTVVTPDNVTVTRQVQDKKNLEGVKPGDRIDITYTQALVINAEPVK